MKKILTSCIVLVCTIGFSTLVSAQGTAPAIGTSHKYWVNANVDGSTQAGGIDNSYTWYLTSTINGTAIDATGATEFVFAEAYNTATKNLFAVNIEWKAPSSGSTYYLHIIETDKDNSCSNHKVEIIKPISNFQLAIANVDEGALGTVVDQDFDNCSPDVTPVLVSDAVRYNYGTTKLYYKVDAKNIDAASFDLEYSIVKTAGPIAITATYGTLSGSDYSSINSLNADGDPHTQTIANTANSSTIYIEVTLDNNNGDNTDFATATVFEGLSPHNVRVTLVSGTQDVATATITDGDAGTTDDNFRNQNILARPGTSLIGSN